MLRILFVCQGNICRSPMAQAIFDHQVRAAGRAADIECNSAGTIGYHAGDPPDLRMQAHAARRGYTMHHYAQKLRPSDFDYYDLIVTMDDMNYDDVRRMAPTPEAQERVHRMTDYCRHKVADCVPDPYYGGASGFENVIDILEDACQGLLETLA